MTIVVALPGSELIAQSIRDELGATLGKLETRRFPDGETYLRLLFDPAGHDLTLVCSLHQPDSKFLPLVFAAATGRRHGARRVGLVAPYAPYMRQDMEFKPGEAVTSATFAALISNSFDWLVTADPHLHRYRSLQDIYTIPTRVAHAAEPIGEWIVGNVDQPLIIGPDSESEQWVAEVARVARAPYRVLEKERRGDTVVNVTVPRLGLGDASTRTPVLVDDIVSSAQTMIEAARQLKALSLPTAVCVAVHALLSEEAYKELASIVSAVVSTDTVSHSSNAIRMGPALARAVRELV
jgi:ribose-phosphate pyrophosphokinase